jgi:hypothetical protein
MTGSKPDTNGTPSWTQIKELFGRAVEVPPAERAAWLEKACNGDQRMREELVSLLEHDDPDDTFLERAIEPSEPGRVGAGARSSRLDPGNRVKSWTVIRTLLLLSLSMHPSTFQEYRVSRHRPLFAIVPWTSHLMSLPLLASTPQQ